MVVESDGYIALIEYLVESLGLFESQQQGSGTQTIEDLVSSRVADNLMAILEMMPLSPDERRIRRDELLAELNLTPLAKHMSHTLSGGEKRRLEIARALVISPAFILMDEPFAGVDPLAVFSIQNIIRQLKARGIGVLISDHNVRETLGVCDKAYILDHGQILESGVPDVIAQSPKAREIYLGEQFRL